MRRSPPGLRLSDLSRDERRNQSGALVQGLLPGGAPVLAGIKQGDIVVALGGDEGFALATGDTASPGPVPNTTP